MTNMTYAQAIDNALEIINTALATDPDMWKNMDVTAEKLKALKEQLGKRSTKKTPTKTQKANEGIMDTIEVALGKFENPITVTELIAGGEGLEGLTNQKVSALLRKMIEAGRVVKTIDGKKALFALACVYQGFGGFSP
jgi:hypothetical protein